MTTQDLINTLRQGAPVTARQVKAIVSQLERIPAMERTLERKDRDFTHLSVAYSAAIEAGKARGVQFTAEECGYVNDALAECERLKEAVRWERECRETFAWLNNTLANIRADLEIHRSLIAARAEVDRLIAEAGGDK